MTNEEIQRLPDTIIALRTKFAELQQAIQAALKAGIVVSISSGEKWVKIEDANVFKLHAGLSCALIPPNADTATVKLDDVAAPSPK